MRIIVSLLFVLIFSGITKAQIKEFSDDPNKFLIEMTSMYTELENKTQRKEGETFMLEKFTPFWNTSLETAQKIKIIENCNQMLKEKMRAYPHFMKYMVSLMNLYESNKMPTTFEAWHSTLAELMKESTSNKFLQFLETSDSLFMSNYLYKSSTTEWQASNNNYQFSYEDEPVVTFPALTLTCYANGDSAVIYNTSGKYYPLKKSWVGDKGKVDWMRAGFKPDEVYAEFGYYTVDLKSRHFNVDSVQFYNMEFFGGKPLLGELEEKVLANRDGDKALYPEFNSYDKRLEIKNIYKDVDFEGGFRMKGPKLLGFGDEIYDAILTFKKDGAPFLISRSKSFAIRKDRVNSDNASLSILFDGDSIYHPGLTMKYLDSLKELSFVRLNEGLAQTPFFNTYHRIEMNFEALYWKMDEPKIDFSMIRGPGSASEALFESMNYYSEARFERIRGIDDIDPLTHLKAYSKIVGSRMFTVLDFAKYRRIQVEYIRDQIVTLAMQGFVYFNPSTDMITVKEKTYDYISSKAKKSDYDVLQFNSIIEKEDNATLSLLNYDLKMRGISRVFLSDSQKVYIYPEEQEIIMQRNRDFTFSGRVHAGLFDYFGKNFSFEYDKFKLNLPIIDSMTFRVRSRTPDDYGYYPLVRVRSVVEDLSGDILIDHPNNKSGLKPYSEYPIFNSKKYSFVYYDKNSDYPGKYPRENFFYRINPFVLDSLDDFSTDGLEFEGYLASAGIFPDIDQPLKVMKDYSLGFIRETGPAGYPAYGGKGTFTDLIRLSNEGLRGDGTLEYLSSESKSDNFLFFPDYMTSTVDEYIVHEQKGGVEYPPVTAKNVEQEWRPYENVLSIKTTDTPARLYAEDSELNGTINITPEGMTGSGVMEFRNAIVVSNNYSFKNRVFDTDTCDFSLKTMEEEELAFNTKNYKGHVDFDERKGEFKSNGGTSLVEFPVNMYICYMDQFDWFMDKDEIELQNNEKNIPGLDEMDIRALADIDLAGSEFISTHPGQDSLRFSSSRAKYSLKDKIIQAYDVKIIKVADAAIFPGDGNVTILKKAEMVPLENAQILANTTTKYHSVSNAKVYIQGANSYTSDGFYDYIDEMEGVQRIYFSEIKVDSTLQTRGIGHISDSAGFTLNPYFDYKGDVNLIASREFLNFDGGARVHHNCDTLPQEWLKFNADINPYEIYIPVPEQPYNTEGEQIFVGLFFSSDSVGVYPTLLNRKYYGGDPELATSYGYITYDKSSNEYRVSSKEKLMQPMLPGKYYSYSVFKCQARAEGKLSFGDNLSRVKMTNYGRADHFMRDDSTMIYTIGELDFFFNDECLKLMQESFAAYPELEATSVKSEQYLKYLGEVLPDEEANKVETELTLYGYLKKMPEALQHTIVFTDLTLKYNANTRSYVSIGDIGIGSMGETQINRYVEGRIELIQKRGGDRLTMYFELSPSEWYFFYYYNGLMTALSSNKEWNDLIINTDPDKRRLKAENGEKAYNYYTSTTSRKKKFLEKTSMEYDEE
ncbi:MAG: hypothetical protein JXR53_02300 [Bacteroidales bacterium]|nr:hypothetical protein [Bacteroidales bacterium]